MLTLNTREDDDVPCRPLANGDGPELQRFNAALSEATRSLFLPHAYDDATLAQIIARAENGTDYAIVGLREDAIIAYAFLWDINDPVPVLGIGVANAFQGLGLGESLMENLIDVATANGCEGIALTTVPENKRAFALYQKMGFHHTGNTDNIAGDGRVVREQVMFLPLKPNAKAPTRVFKPPV